MLWITRSHWHQIYSVNAPTYVQATSMISSSKPSSFFEMSIKCRVINVGKFHEWPRWIIRGYYCTIVMVAQQSVHPALLGSFLHYFVILCAACLVIAIACSCLMSWKLACLKIMYLFFVEENCAKLVISFIACWCLSYIHSSSGSVPCLWKVNENQAIVWSSHFDKESRQK